MCGCMHVYTCKDRLVVASATTTTTTTITPPRKKEKDQKVEKKKKTYLLAHDKDMSLPIGEKKKLPV